MTPNIVTCRLCGAVGKLVESHVIPKALHLDVKPEGDNLRVYSNSARHGQRCHTGVYGLFLCESCENAFAPYDEYGVKFVKRHKDGIGDSPICESFQRGFETSVDYAKLKLWVMSMLWRADVCDDMLYEKVDLGPKWRKALADSIRSKTPGDANHFSVVATIFDEEYSRLGAIFSPFPGKLSGVNFYKFYLPWGFTFFIKVDQRRPPQMLEPVTLKKGQPFIVTLGPYSDHEWKTLEAMTNGLDDDKPI